MKESPTLAFDDEPRGKQLDNTTNDLLTIRHASAWVSKEFGLNISPANISYLVQYRRVPSVSKNGREVLLRKGDLIDYYTKKYRDTKSRYVKGLGEELNWALSFDTYKEAETTKHVHRLHPYKGKFIPQLVEYFLDGHVDEFKHEVIFRAGDVVLDPFCGSGTTLVQANELGIHGIGVDVSQFNAMISNQKLSNVCLVNLDRAIRNLTLRIAENPVTINLRTFEELLSQGLKAHNQDVDQSVEDFDATFLKLMSSHSIENSLHTGSSSFLKQWYFPGIRSEIAFLRRFINEEQDVKVRGVLQMILSRAARSVRATHHAELATLVKPVQGPYFCAKHGKVCVPRFSIYYWWNRYCKDTLKRLHQFRMLRSNTHQECVVGDSRTIDLMKSVENRKLRDLIENQGIKGIFSSPPYVGLIDYHDQHAYSYEILGLPRRDELEIGPLSSGQGRIARETYVTSIAKVLRNLGQYLVEDAQIILVANDKYELFPQIAQLADLTICQEYRRPVLNRAEGNKGVYGESIFRMKAKK